VSEADGRTVGAFPPLPPPPAPLDRDPARAAVLLVGAGVALWVWTLLVQTEVRDPAGPSPTVEGLEQRLLDNPAGLVTAVATKFLLAGVGLVLLILHLSRRGAICRGELPPPPRGVAPPFPPPVFAILAALLGAFFVHRFVAGLGAAPGGETSAEGVLHTAIASVVIGVAVVLARRRSAVGLPRLPVRTLLGAGVRVFLVSTFVLLVLGYLAVVVMKYVFGLTPLAQDLVREVIETKDERMVWTIVVFGTLVAPFTEEAIFRGLLYPAVHRVAGRTVAALSVSILFAATHLDAYAYLPLLGLALMLAGLFEATQSVLAVTVVHALSNLSSIIPILALRSLS
jgi:membrane protease YdiL (CAAX protease family)